ncbi:hypothetical protein ARNL5_03926 [Anaerolineae bacterium]|nr:hypothetical protein ARNL5_03926 [Anaerolineae bacterium]
MTPRTIRRSLVMTPEMHDRLQQLLSKRGREVTESDLIREAVRRFLDEQETLIGSRRHFQKTLQDRIDLLELTLSFHLNVLLLLLASTAGGKTALQSAIIAARREGARLLAQMKAVRDLPDEPRP